MRLVFAASIILSGLFAYSACAQPVMTEKVLFKIDTMRVTSEEFKYALNKNNYSGKKLGKEDIDDYLGLYINFKLKVYNAYALGNDTLKSFVSEFNQYKNQLDESYLQKDVWLDSLAGDVYDRLKSIIRASHLLIITRNQADTLPAYNRIMKVFDQANNGGDFNELVSEYSEDPSVRYNSGDLGFFTAMQLVLPFEEMAYKTPIGNFSRPFRTQYGYHILKVTDKRPNPGSVNVAHIMLRFKPGMTATDSANVRQSVNDLYSRLMNGENWDHLCSEYSEDNNTKNNSGRLPEFGVGKMVPAFSDAAFALRDPGDISRPVQTPSGWHVIKLLGKTPLREFADMKTELREQIRQDERHNLVQKKYIDHLADEYQYSFDEDVMEECMAQADSQLLKGKWVYPSGESLPSATIAMINSRKYPAGEFFDFIIKNQQPSRNLSPSDYMKMLFEDFREKILTDYERENLASKFPDYRWLVKEYKEGILMFNLMDEQVWAKAAEDSTGSLEYFNRHREDYTTAETAKATIVLSNDTSVLNAIARDLDRNYYPAGFSSASFNSLADPEMKKALDSVNSFAGRRPDLYISVSGNKKILESLKNSVIRGRQYNESKFVYHGDESMDSVTLTILTTSKKSLSDNYSGYQGLILQIDTGTYERGAHEILNMLEWKAGKYYLSIEDKEYVLLIEKIYPARLKNINEARGELITDYQKYLESEWINDLRERYPVEMNKKALKEIYRQFEN